MAAIAKSGTPVPCSDIPQSNKLTLDASGAIEAGDICYITSAGKFAKADGSANAAAAHAYGMATNAAPDGRPVTVAFGVRFHYAAGQTPGSLAYLSPTVLGGLDSANATVTRPIGRFIDATRIQVFGPFHKALV